VTKLLYLGNVIGQFYLLDRFLGGFHLYGFRVVREFFRNGWPLAFLNNHKMFPRVTLCDFRVRQMGNSHPHTVQCVLPINFFSEKIYLVLWFWLAALGAVTALSILCWACVLLPEHGRRRYVRQNLKIMSRLKSSSDTSSSTAGSGGSAERDRERKAARRFVEAYLRQDGVFVLQLVARNSTDLVVADIIAALWDNFRSKPPSSSAVDDRRPGVGPTGDCPNVIGVGRTGRHQSIGMAYDVGDLSMDPVDIV
jgi:hypothetical protein